MNERIKEFAKQAGFYKYGDDFEYIIEKFAELIVRECMSLVSEPGPDMNDTERGILAQIKKHFGVDE